MKLLIGALAIVISMGLSAQAEVKDAKAQEAGQGSKSVLETELGFDTIITQMNKDLERNTVLLRQKTLVLPAKTVLYKGKSEGNLCKEAADQTASDNDCLKLEVFDFQDSETGKTDYGFGSRAKYMILQFEGGSVGTGDPFKEAPRKLKRIVFNVKIVDFVNEETRIANIEDTEPSLANTGTSNDLGGSHDEKTLVFYTLGSPELNFVASYALTENSTNKGDGLYTLKNVENTKTHSIRNTFKKDFLVKNLHYFRDLFVNIADFNEKAALAKYKRNADYFRASLKY